MPDVETPKVGGAASNQAALNTAAISNGGSLGMARVSWLTRMVNDAKIPEGGLTEAEADSHRAGTASRDATVLKVGYHNFCSMVGAGVLALPTVMAALGWGFGTVALFLSWFISLQTFIFLVKLHEQGDFPNVRRMDRYPQLTQHAFRKRIGTWMLTPFQLILFTGSPIAYTITGAESLQKAVSLLAPQSSWGGIEAGGGLSRWIVLFSVLQLFVVQVRTFHSLSWVSLTGAAASVFYILVAFIGSLVKGKQPGISYGQPVGWTSTADRLFGIFNALATSAFAYGGHIIACEIQATLPLPPSTINRMMLSVKVTFLLTALCYFSVAFSGYWAYGNTVAPNIISTLNRPVGVIVAANLAVFFHVMAGYHVYLFPLIDMADGVAVRNLGILPSSLLWRLCLRTLFVVVIALAGCAVPFFGVVLGFLGAVSITPTTFMMPCALWLKLRKPTAKDWRLYFCWATLAIMSVVMVLGAIGAVRDFVNEVVHGHAAKPFAW